MSVERMQWVGHHLASTQSPWGDRPVGGGMGAFLPWGKLSQEAPGPGAAQAQPQVCTNLRALPLVALRGLGKHPPGGSAGRTPTNHPFLGAHGAGRFSRAGHTWKWITAFHNVVIYAGDGVTVFMTLFSVLALGEKSAVFLAVQASLPVPRAPVWREQTLR